MRTIRSFNELVAYSLSGVVARLTSAYHSLLPLAAASCLLLAGLAIISASADVNQLSVSANRRYLQLNGKPFFWLGDTNWSLFTLYDPAEAKRYLAHRSSQGFTVVHVMIPFDGGDELKTRSSNSKGQQPWLDMNPATPNPAFFEGVDQVVAAAAEQHLLLAMMPLGGSSGAFLKRDIFTAANVRTYGRWLGNRYKDASNIIWVNGFDLPPASHLEITRALVDGLREGDRGRHLVTYHPSGGATSSYFQREDWLAFNLIQAWGEWWQIPPMVRADYDRAPVKPVVMAECSYEAGEQYPTRPITPLIVRKQAWWSYLSGGFYTYGHNFVWRKDPGWQGALDSPGARQMTLAKRMLTSIPWWTLVPDQSIIGSGAGSGDKLNTAARFSGGAVVYLSHPGPVTLDLAKVEPAKSLRATWWNPESGESKRAGEFRPAPQIFTSPWTTEDAVLVLEPVR